MVWIAYDGEADALLIELRRDVSPEHGEEVAPGVTLDLDADGNVVSIEIMDAAQRLGRESLTSVHMEFSDAARRESSGTFPPGYAESSPETWLSVAAAAERVNVSTQAIHRAIKEGRLRGALLRPGSSRWMVAEASLERWEPDRVRQAAGKTRGA